MNVEFSWISRFTIAWSLTGGGFYGSVPIQGTRNVTVLCVLFPVALILEVVIMYFWKLDGINSNRVNNFFFSQLQFRFECFFSALCSHKFLFIGKVYFFLDFKMIIVGHLVIPLNVVDFCELFVSTYQVLIYPFLLYIWKFLHMLSFWIFQILVFIGFVHCAWSWAANGIFLYALFRHLCLLFLTICPLQSFFFSTHFITLFLQLFQIVFLTLFYTLGQR